MAVVNTKAQTRYVQNIAAIDEATDNITLSERNPANPGAMGSEMPGMAYTFVATKPHNYVTGQAFTFTQTVETV